MKKIISIQIVKQEESDGDFSYLGAFTDVPVSHAIIRFGEHAGKFVRDLPANEWLISGREYRFFLPANDTHPDYQVKNWKRAEALNNGEWGFVGIYASAKVQFSENGPIQTLRSGGLYGIESDSGEAYFSEVGNEELESLGDVLAGAGFDEDSIFRALQTVEKSS